MKYRKEHNILQIFVQVFFVVIFGVIFLGPYVIIPTSSFFTFSLYGFSAIIFYYLITNYGLRYFLLIGSLLTIFLISVFKPSLDVLALTRNLSWYILIGIITFCIYKIGDNRTKLIIIAKWFVGFIILYTLMSILNLYLFRFYKTNNSFTIIFYLKQAFKIGGILGMGIGIGKVIADSLFQKNLKTAKTRI